ncbi:MAG: four helix bundle protein [Clostridia bacterium]|nr:four helix bundle protein [Clostridia bacterium]
MFSLTPSQRDFSVDIINLVKYLKANHETIISNQIGRNGTSIGANIL